MPDEPPEPDPTTPATGAGDPFHFGRDDIHQLLDVTVVSATPEQVVLSLPVTWKVHQPAGLLHGGVSALLAESAASFGAGLSDLPDGTHVVGIELNASHLRGIREGTLVATAVPVRKGRTVQVWAIHLTDQDGRAICEARCTLAIADSHGRAGLGA
jgi:1,4-dihydroxy-2-naphthoyl-CoA hydrolase